ncbi:PfkB family carbohydrate kinase [Enterococcus sp. 2201sp1_2201st1_C11_2201SCRN_220225]|uniref:PfkB family carbohydrate kinase n=2 Tax=unclassified Enterococcus TaxID=2608891 RepID=UPI0034A3FE9E
MSDYVVGFGDNKVDYYTNQNIKYPGGNAVNFAVAGKKSGVEAFYVGTISDDADGQLIIDGLNENKVDLHYCNRTGSPSEKVFVEIKDGERIFVSSQRGSRQTPDLSAELLELFGHSLLVHSGCHAKTEDKLSEIKASGTKISFDFSDLEKYRTDEYLDEVCPNIFIAQFSVSKDSPLEIERLKKRCIENNVRFILLTKGSESPLFVDTKNEITYQGFIRKSDSVLDTMGAGDSYFAAFAVQLMRYLQDGEINEEKVIDCFKKAANLAYDVLQVNGAFGCGVPID